MHWKTPQQRSRGRKADVHLVAPTRCCSPRPSHRSPVRCGPGMPHWARARAALHRPPPARGSALAGPASLDRQNAHRSRPRGQMPSHSGPGATEAFSRSLRALAEPRSLHRSGPHRVSLSVAAQSPHSEAAASCGGGVSRAVRISQYGSTIQGTALALRGWETNELRRFHASRSPGVVVV
jgi:hypothetical protein